MVTANGKRGTKDGKVAGHVVRYSRDRREGECFTRVSASIDGAWVYLGAWPCETPPRGEVASAIAGMRGLIDRNRYAGV